MFQCISVKMYLSEVKLFEILKNSAVKLSKHFLKCQNFRTCKSTDKCMLITIIRKI